MCDRRNRKLVNICFAMAYFDYCEIRTIDQTIIGFIRKEEDKTNLLRILLELE